MKKTKIRPGWSGMLRDVWLEQNPALEGVFGGDYNTHFVW